MGFVSKKTLLLDYPEGFHRGLESTAEHTFQENESCSLW